MVSRRDRDVEPPQPAWIHAFLAKEIRRLRELAGLTQVQAANALHISDRHFSAIESANRLPRRDAVVVLDDAVDGKGSLIAIRDELINDPGPGWFKKLLDFEREASAIWQYDAQVIPGMLQTEGYAREVLRAAPQRRTTRSSVEDALTIRLDRQVLIERTDPPAPEMAFVIDEHALQRRPSDPKILRDQLERLLDVGRLDHVTIQILPVAGGFHSMLEGSVTLLRFDDDDDIVYLEPLGQAVIAYDPVTVVHATRRFDLLRAEALPPSDSATLIRSHMESL